jgi:hypothetical protein
MTALPIRFLDANTPTTKRTLGLPFVVLPSDIAYGVIMGTTCLALGDASTPYPYLVHIRQDLAPGKYLADVFSAEQGMVAHAQRINSEQIIGTISMREYFDLMKMWRARNGVLEPNGQQLADMLKLADYYLMNPGSRRPHRNQAKKPS